MDDFLQQLRNDMDNLEEDYEFIDKESLKFAVWIGQTILEFEPKQVMNALLIYADDTDGAVLGHFDENKDRVNVTICWHEPTAAEISEDRFHSLTALWERIRLGKATVFDAGEELIDNLSDKGLAWDSRLIIYTNGMFNQGQVQQALELGIQLVGLNQLKNEFYRTQYPLNIQGPETLDISLSSQNGFVRSFSTEQNSADESSKTLVCAIPLQAVHEWVEQFGNGLFADNQRLRLSGYDKQKAKELEENIKNTIKRNPEQMIVQNNGITITCSQIGPAGFDLGHHQSQPVTLTIAKPQIVNGCQTSWAIFGALEECKDDAVPLPDGYVVAKIIETSDKALSDKITNSSNTQNAIFPRDQRSNDQCQIEISQRLSNYGGNNLGIFWDHRRGGYGTIEAEEQEYKYQIKGKQKRILANGVAGQVMLAMAGAVHEAKNNASQIFSVDKLYHIAFRHDLSADERFAGLNNPMLSSGIDNHLQSYADDLLFGYAILRYAEAVFKELYIARDKQIKDENAHDVSDKLESLGAHEFVKFWRFDVVRMVHVVVEHWAKRPGTAREEVRASLINNLFQDKYLNQIFLTNRVISEWFNPESETSNSNVLDQSDPSTELPLLGQWFKSLEDQVGLPVMRKLRQQSPNVSHQQLVLKRHSTHEFFMQQLDELLNGAVWMNLFPIDRS